MFLGDRSLTALAAPDHVLRELLAARKLKPNLKNCGVAQVRSREFAMRMGDILSILAARLPMVKRRELS